MTEPTKPKTAEEFERLAHANRWSLHKSHGHYTDVLTAAGWEMWQASALHHLERARDATCPMCADRLELRKGDRLHEPDPDDKYGHSAECLGIMIRDLIRKVEGA